MTRAKKTDEPEVTENDGNETEATEVETTTTPVYNANDGLYGRDGGPYLDQVEAKIAEDNAAARDGGTPDYDNPRGYAGIEFRTAAQQRDQYNPTTLAGDDIKHRQNADDTPLEAPPYGEVEVPVTDGGEDVPVSTVSSSPLGVGAKIPVGYGVDQSPPVSNVNNEDDAIVAEGDNEERQNPVFNPDSE